MEVYHDSYFQGRKFESHLSQWKENIAWGRWKLNLFYVI
jgi:hypothetical protein